MAEDDVTQLGPELYRHGMQGKPVPSPLDMARLNARPQFEYEPNPVGKSQDLLASGMGAIGEREWTPDFRGTALPSNGPQPFGPPGSGIDMAHVGAVLGFLAKRR